MNSYTHVAGKRSLFLVKYLLLLFGMNLFLNPVRKNSLLDVTGVNVKWAVSICLLTLGNRRQRVQDMRISPLLYLNGWSRSGAKCTFSMKAAPYPACPWGQSPGEWGKLHGHDVQHDRGHFSAAQRPNGTRSQGSGKGCLARWGWLTERREREKLTRQT